MNMNATKEKSVRLQLKEMEIGDQIAFPLDKYSSIKSATSAYGLEWNRKYSTSSDRESRTVTVTRES